MRDIKFRAWNHNKMYLVDAIDFSGCAIRKGDPCFIEDKQNGGCFLLENSMLMQYTGLKDKNGKEIYEGDIIEWGHFKPRWEVKWDEGYSAWAIVGQTYTYGFTPTNKRDMEVIGNIYENKELLNAQSTQESKDR